MARLHTHAQHFLASPELVLELIGHSNIRKNDLVYDLGAGSGVISAALAKRCRAVVAVELESSALALLRRNTVELDNVRAVEADMMDLDLPDDRYKVFSNIPFSLSSSVVKRLTTAPNPPISIYLIVQKQFARKLIPSDRHFTSSLGAQIAPWWTGRIRRPLRRQDFTPPPAVDTVLMELKPNQLILLELREREAYQQFVDKCYSRQKYFISLQRATIGIDPERKPSELSPEQWVDLYKHTRK